MLARKLLENPPPAAGWDRPRQSRRAGAVSAATAQNRPESRVSQFGGWQHLLQHGASRAGRPDGGTLPDGSAAGPCRLSQKTCADLPAAEDLGQTGTDSATRPRSPCFSYSHSGGVSGDLARNLPFAHRSHRQLEQVGWWTQGRLLLSPATESRSSSAAGAAGSRQRGGYDTSQHCPISCSGQRGPPSMRSSPLGSFIEWQHLHRPAQSRAHCWWSRSKALELAAESVAERAAEIAPASGSRFSNQLSTAAPCRRVAQAAGNENDRGRNWLGHQLSGVANSWPPCWRSGPRANRPRSFQTAARGCGSGTSHHHSAVSDGRDGAPA